MASNNDLIENIKEWIQLDSTIREYQADMRAMRKRKTELTNTLVDVMKDKDIDVFDINNGKLIYSQYKYTAPLSKKHLLNSLGSLFAHDPEKIEQISNHILNSREVKIKEKIRRKIENNN